MTLLVEPDDTAAGLIASALGTGARLLPHLETARDMLAADTSQDVVVVGPNIDAAAAFRLAGDYRVTRPTLGVVLVRRRVETSLLAEALRHGVRDVVEERDLAGINDAVQRAQQLADELRLVGEGDVASIERPRGKVITVFSAKGGCGKTTVSTNLGAMLASEFGQHVCLVDLDLEFGDVAISLQLVPAHNIYDAVAMGKSLDADGLRGLLTPHSTGLQALTAPISPDTHQSIKPELVERILDLLAAEFDVVIVDTPPSFDDTVLATFDRTDVLVLLTTMDVPAIKNLKIAIETLHMLNFSPDKTRVIVNRSDSRVGLNVGDVEKSIRLPVTGRIPSSRDVPTSTNRGAPLAIENPRHPVSQALRDFIRTQLEITARAGVPDVSNTHVQRRGLLRGKKG
jgi:pilus assembly protein CpaE